MHLFRYITHVWAKWNSYLHTTVWPNFRLLYRLQYVLAHWVGCVCWMRKLLLNWLGQPHCGERSHVCVSVNGFVCAESLPFRSIKDIAHANTATIMVRLRCTIRKLRISMMKNLSASKVKWHTYEQVFVGHRFSLCDAHFSHFQRRASKMIFNMYVTSSQVNVNQGYFILLQE